ADEVTVDDEALRLLAGEYTREAGVRQLERALARVLRKVATRLADDPSAAPLSVTASSLRDYLGRPRFVPESAERTAVPGVATGLAVTGAGGDVLFVEATAMQGKPGLTLTGQLGDVMKESAHIAVSYLKAHGSEFGIDPERFDRSVHVHVPAGAVPKDGPSAGVTMVTALASLVSGRPVSNEVAMTGEVTLTGQVLPIGGLKEKSLAAQRAGIKRVIVPERNEGDVAEIPEHERNGLEFVYASEIGEVLEAALDGGPAAKKS